MNHSNKDGNASAESGEGRPLIKENVRQPNTSPTQSGERVSQGLAGVRKAAGNNKEMKFTALLHHLTVELLRESFYSLKRKAAPGVDGVTWQEYENGLEDRLTDLHGRVHRGAYRATPARRVYIEKADGRQRPLAVPAIEDKLVQHAVVTIFAASPVVRVSPLRAVSIRSACWGLRFIMVLLNRSCFLGVHET
jgi:RNA-directed DNA polymerase